MKTVLRYVQMAGAFLNVNVKKGLEYPAYLIGWIFSNLFQFVFGIATVWVVVSKFQPLDGWGFEQMAFLYGLGIISHGFAIVLFIQTWYMGYFVTEGEFDRMLVRPLNVFFQFCFINFNFIGFTDLIPGVIIFVFGCISVNFNISFSNILNLLLAVIGATTIRGGIYTTVGAISFWTQRTDSISRVTGTLLEYSNKYPITIYPKIIQLLFTVLIPIGFISFYPSAELLTVETGFSLPGNLCVWTFFVGIVVYTVGILVFNMGLRRYESSGS